MYALYTVFKERLDAYILKAAVYITSEKRGSLEDLKEWRIIINEIAADNTIQQLWFSYRQEYTYAKEISFDALIDVLLEFGKLVNDTTNQEEWSSICK